MLSCQCQSMKHLCAGNVCVPMSTRCSVCENQQLATVRFYGKQVQENTLIYNYIKVLG